MAFSNDTKRDAATARRAFDLDLSLGDGDWSEEAARGRDWKKMFLVLGLGTLSWVATYIGMLELIQSNLGDLPLIHKLVIGFSVAMLMTMIVWLLDQMFAPIPTATKLAYISGYVFLTLISVGFGFGFYWKVLESRSESSRSAESAVTQVQSSLHAASTRMVQLSTTLEQLNQVSIQKAELERTKGTSCPNSRPGDGPRRKLRDEDAQRFAFAAEFVKTRVGSVNGDLAALDGDLAKVVGDDKSTIDKATGTRNDFMNALGRKLDMTVTGFNAFRTDPQLKQLRADLGERAEKTIFPDGHGGTFTCPDPQLQQALKGVVRAIDQLPDLEKPKIAAVEGSEATIEAFRRLTATFYGALSFKLPPSADELRDLQKKAVQSVEASPAVSKAISGEPTVGLSKRDYIPLAIALFVDLCLLLVSMSRPMNRLNGLVPKMRAAERGPVIQILSRFNEIHRDDEIRRNFEVFRHVVFDFHGAYYVAVPLDAPYKPSGAYTKGFSTEDIEDLTHEAHLLANLFTSFEKEKIFSRVYSPLLTTRAVKKKLLRQGSKFAHADAFRIYRFRDGAWSEIILGAVMGAARRVEAEKKKRRLEQQLFERPEPALSSASSVTHANDSAATEQGRAQPAAEQSIQTAQDNSFAAPLTVEETRVAAGGRGGFLSRRGMASASSAPVREPRMAGPGTMGAGAETIAEFGPYAARASREIAEERYRATLPTLRGEDGALDRPRRRRGAQRSADAGAAGEEIPAGEVVLFAIPGNTSGDEPPMPNKPEQGESVAFAPVEDIPAMPEAEATRVASAPESETAARSATTTPHLARPPHRIGVVLRRETAEFTLPVTEASLPAAMTSGDLAKLVLDAEAMPPQLNAPGARIIEPAGALQSVGNTEFASGADDLEQDASEEEHMPLFEEPDIDIRIDDISRRFRPTAGE